ncbi:MAG: hypothetical protein AAF366_06475, partial [Pseudomonadota bacterium]
AAAPALPRTRSLDTGYARLTTPRPAPPRADQAPPSDPIAAPAEMAAALETAIARADVPPPTARLRLDALRPTPPAVDGPPTRITAPPRPTATFAAIVAAEESFEIDGMLTGWSVDLPARAFDPGDEKIVGVNGIEVADRNEFDRAVQRSARPSPSGEVDVSVTRDTADGATEETSLTLPIVQRTMLVNGLAFETRYEDDTWVTRITEVPDLLEDTLQVGDVVYGYIPTNERLSNRTDLPRILRTAAETKAVTLALAIERDDAVYAVSLPSIAAEVD